MDELTAAIVDLTKEIGNLKGDVGKLTGKTDGLGREIGDLKNLISSDGCRCQACKAEINDEIEKVDEKVEDLKAHGAQISQQNAEDIRNITGKTIPAIEKRMGVVEKHIESEQSVSMWKDKTITEIGKIVGMVSGILAITTVVVGWVLHFIWTGSLM